MQGRIQAVSPSEERLFAVASTTRRRLALAALAGLLLVGTAAGGLVWSVTRCDRSDYLKYASVSWVNQQEEYLFACGHVWHSLDAGQTWKQIPSSGLPWLLRDGRIAEDRTVGRLYLAVILAVPSSLRCLLCPFAEVQPSMYMSEDGGQHWRLTARFPPGLTGYTSIRTISADPDYSDAGWVILVMGPQADYYATNTGGRRWRLTCVEQMGYFCDPPADFLAAHHRQNGANP